MLFGIWCYEKLLWFAGFVVVVYRFCDPEFILFLCSHLYSPWLCCAMRPRNNMTPKMVTRLKRFWKVCRSSWMYDPFNTFIFHIVLPCVEDICYLHGENGSCIPLTTPIPSVQIRDGDLVCVRELVGKCLAEYATSKCSRPNGRRLRWIISGRTARHLKHSYYKITHLPTIPESAY